MFLCDWLSQGWPSCSLDVFQSWDCNDTDLELKKWEENMGDFFWLSQLLCINFYISRILGAGLLSFVCVFIFKYNVIISMPTASSDLSSQMEGTMWESLRTLPFGTSGSCCFITFGPKEKAWPAPCLHKRQQLITARGIPLSHNLIREGESRRWIPSWKWCMQREGPTKENPNTWQSQQRKRRGGG